MAPVVRSIAMRVLGEGFTANYGWAEIIGPNGFFAGDDFLLGLLMLGPAPSLPRSLSSGTRTLLASHLRLAVEPRQRTIRGKAARLNDLASSHDHARDEDR